MVDETEKEEVQEEKKEEQAKGEEPEEEEAKEEKEKPLEKMTAKELREIARQIPDVTGVHAMKKEQLLEVLKKARGIKEEEPVKKKKKKTPKRQVSVGELKKKIAFLKEQREAARLDKGRKKVEILRRRINRLKKRTRKVAQA